MFSLYIVWYLFLAGCGSGAFCIASLLDLVSWLSSNSSIKEYHSITRGGLLSGPCLVLLAALFLVFDLGSPHLAYMVFMTPKISVLTVGAWSVVLFCLTALAFSASRLPVFSRVPQVMLIALETVATIASFSVMAYTGVLVSGFAAVPFLHTPLVIALFIISSLSTGASVITLYGFFNQHKKAMHFQTRIIPKLDLFFLILDVMVLAALVLMVCLTGSETAQHSVARLIAGDLAVVFWLFVVGVGIIAPVAIALFDSERILSLALSATMLLVGGFALRYCIVNCVEYVRLGF
jgi:formate-dependent nitrite reductase membrane component NrfD